ncbi:phosphoglycerate dehydrogenase [Wukongibacter baidiensis]|uniref:phosphoglycerate dehydrogenase n=1 Tax=Wukongibacter baidiensis TaxID=1723361 RepID=UPI003D7F72F1
MKVLFTYHYGEEKMKAVSDLGYEVIHIPEKEVSNCDEIEDIEVLVCYTPFNSLDISKLNNLRWIQLSSIGSDQAPYSYIKEKGIFLTNNKGGYSIPMGEWIVLKILEIYKNSKYFYNKQREKEWKLSTDVLEIYGKNVGFIGTGSIAKEGAKRLQGFGANIYGLNTKGSSVEYFDKCFAMEEIDELLSICDIVVCTIPYTKMTHNLLNKEKIDKMKDASVLINVSRGNIINEDDLITALKEGKFLGVALDVFDEEPLPKDNPLWSIDKVYITPHNSWVSEMRNERRFKNIYENMRRYINGEALINLIDLDRGY